MSPDSFERPDVVLEVRCAACPGVIDRVVRVEVDAAVREHFAQWHPLLRPTDRWWQADPAQHVCEVCWSILELPWEHVSSPPTAAAGMQDQSGTWLLCDLCHALHAGGRVALWVRWAWEANVQRATWLRYLPSELQTDARAQLADTLRLLLQRLDGGRRVTVASW